MSLGIQQALPILSDAARARNADGRLEDRLLEVRSLIGGDIVAVETALHKAAATGTSPGGEAALHLIGQGGKRIRPLALLLSTACFGEIDEAARTFATVAELLHSATLLHDDVVDEGMERRGAVTARRRFGNGVSVLAGDLLLVRSLQLTSETRPALMPGLIETLDALIDGELVQLKGRVELDIAEATYFRVLRNKTASLFRWATRTGAALGGANAQDCERLGRFGEALGVAFQLVDDVIDYAGEQTGKTLFADLSEGKLTLPLVLTAARDPEIFALVRQIHEGSRDPVKEVARRVVDGGACDEVRERAKAYTHAAVAELQGLPKTAARSLLCSVAEQLTHRAG